MESEEFLTMATTQLSVLRVTGVLGAVLFGFFFVLTFSTPQWVERFAVEFIETRVSEKVNLGIDAYQPSPSEGIAGRLAQELYEQNQAALDDLKGTIQARRARNVGVSPRGSA